jgi:hypothetical protein
MMAKMFKKGDMRSVPNPVSARAAEAMRHDGAKMGKHFSGRNHGKL